MEGLVIELYRVAGVRYKTNYYKAVVGIHRVYGFKPIKFKYVNEHYWRI